MHPLVATLAVLAGLACWTAAVFTDGGMTGAALVAIGVVPWVILTMAAIAGAGGPTRAGGAGR